MSIRIEQDTHAPTAAVELTIRRPLPDYDIEEIEHPIPRDVDMVLASQGFLDLLDEARGILGTTLERDSLQIVQLTGAICSEGEIHRAGVWLVLREQGAPAGAPMSSEAKARVTAVADELSRRLQLS
jgi:hypothetical protein